MNGVSSTSYWGQILTGHKGCETMSWREIITIQLSLLDNQKWIKWMSNKYSINWTKTLVNWREALVKKRASGQLKRGSRPYCVECQYVELKKGCLWCQKIRETMSKSKRWLSKSKKWCQKEPESTPLRMQWDEIIRSRQQHVNFVYLPPSRQRVNNCDIFFVFYFLCFFFLRMKAYHYIKGFKNNTWLTLNLRLKRLENCRKMILGMGILKFFVLHIECNLLNCGLGDNL